MWVKNNTDKKAFIMTLFTYLLINIACVKDLLVSEMAYERRMIISSSFLEEMDPLKSYILWISIILYFAAVTAICGPRRWSTSFENQWSVSKYITIFKNLASWNTGCVICGKSVNRTSGSI
jgi:hypothetical protein